MKVILFCMIVPVIIFANSEELISEYKNMFEKISQQRVGLDEKEIEKVKSPFVAIEKEQKKKVGNKQNSNVYVLEAIFGKKVMINGKWYKLYSKVGDAKIISIKDDSVLLKRDTNVERLTIRKKNEYISIK